MSLMQLIMSEGQRWSLEQEHNIYEIQREIFPESRFSVVFGSVERFEINSDHSGRERSRLEDDRVKGGSCIMRSSRGFLIWKFCMEL